MERLLSVCLHDHQTQCMASNQIKLIVAEIDATEPPWNKLILALRSRRGIVDTKITICQPINDKPQILRNASRTPDRPIYSHPFCRGRHLPFGYSDPVLLFLGSWWASPPIYCNLISSWHYSCLVILKWAPCSQCLHFPIPYNCQTGPTHQHDQLHLSLGAMLQHELCVWFPGLVHQTSLASSGLSLENEF